MHKAVSAFLIGFCCTLVTAGLFVLGVFETLELKTLDERFRLIPASAAMPPEDIAIVTIDQNSLDYINQNMLIGWPWPREFYGLIIEFLSGAGAKAVVFDMHFTEHNTDRLETTGSKSDKGLEDATARSGRVHHAYLLKADGLAPTEAKAAALADRLAETPVENNNNHLPVFGTVALPSPELIRNSRAMGFVTLIPERDGIVRRMPLMAQWDDKIVLSLSLAVARDVVGQQELVLTDDELTLDGQPLAIDPDGRIFLWWYQGERGAIPAFPYYPACDVIASAVQEKSDLAPVLDASLFKNKIIFLGASATGIGDIKAIPLSGAVPGVEIQATALANLLNHASVSRCGQALILALLLFICLAVSLSSRLIKHAWLGIALLISILIMIGLGGFSLLMSQHLFLDVVPLFTGALLTYTSTILVNYLAERKHAMQIRHIFEHYLDEKVVKKLIADPSGVKLGGEERFCTVLFMDVANFTHLSEQMEPEQVVRFMNLYLDEMTRIIVAKGGFVDKYVGDQIVAIFGAPQDLPDHTLHTCHAVLQMRARIGELQSRFQEMGCKEEVFPRTGVATGPIIVGNMGSENRMNYTGMGDVMNTGARLEGVNKIYGTRILVSEDTATNAKDSFRFREVDQVRVKGKDKGLKVYELIDEPHLVSQEMQLTLADFSEGLALYRSQQWVGAEARFAKASSQNDGPSEVFITRCRNYAEVPPPPDWDGIYTMTVK